MRVPLSEFETVFGPVEPLVLEETANVLTVSPIVQADPAGGLLIADNRERQFRRYTEHGTLLWYFGRPGQGPEEFASAVSIARVGPEEVVAAQLTAKLLLWNEQRAATVRTIPQPDIIVHRLHAIGPGRVLIQSFVNIDKREVLHVLDMASGGIVNSFFSPPLTDLIPPTRMNALGGHVPSAVRGDTVASVFAFADTLYLHDIESGRALEKIVLPTNHSVLPSRGPGTSESQGPWLEHVSRNWALYWLDTGEFVLDYIPVGGDGLRRSLLGINRDGTPSFEIASAPGNVLAMDRTGATYLHDPESLLPKRLLVAKRTK